ncbi:hypothetical protein D3C86_1496380 [compost metagenome]
MSLWLSPKPIDLLFPAPLLEVLTFALAELCLLSFHTLTWAFPPIMSFVPALLERPPNAPLFMPGFVTMFSIFTGSPILIPVKFASSPKSSITWIFETMPAGSFAMKSLTLLVKKSLPFTRSFVIPLFIVLTLYCSSTSIPGSCFSKSATLSPSSTRNAAALYSTVSCINFTGLGLALITTSFSICPDIFRTKASSLLCLSLSSKV